MGWTQLLESKDWSAEVDALLDEDASDGEVCDTPDSVTPADTFEDHSLYRAAFSLTIWMFNIALPFETPTAC